VTTTEVGTFDLPASHTDPAGARTEFGYDTELRLITVTNPAGLTWRYDYDPAGNLVAETDFNGRTLRYRHDAAGQLVERVNGAGETTRLDYDALGNLVEQRSGDAVTRFDFDLAGRLARARNADADVIFERDLLGRLRTETTNGRTMASSYDAAGRRVRRVTPSGAESTWAYDAAARPIALTTAGRTVHFGHDAAGREVERRLSPQTVLAQAWDAGSRLLSQTLLGPTPGAGGQQVVQRRSYRYRPDGMLTGVDDHLAGSRSYHLDPAGRITAVSGPEWTEQYGYDRAGNVSTAVWPGPEAAEAAGARDYTGTLLRRAGNVRYEYDGQGRVVLRQQRRLSRKPASWRYEWDADDRLVAVTTPAGQRWRYRYDPFGRRIAKQRLDSDGSTVLEQLDFAWDDGRLVEETRTDWWPGLAAPIASQATVWDWQPGTFQPVSQRHLTSVAGRPQEWIDQEFYSIVADLAGTPAELVDDRGAVVWRARASVWGVATGRTPAAPSCPLRFPGQYFDPETALNYNNQRYYDPVGARYQSPDPIGLAAAPDDHAYVVNPTSWIDPLGLTPCTANYTQQSASHVYSHGHAANSPQLPNKSRFNVTEGGQKFTDEVINHPNVNVVNQTNGRISYTVDDLGRGAVGRTQTGAPATGGQVIVEGPNPASWSTYSPGEVVTQYPR
jgi:RHS repeat-associated protein